MKYKIYLIKIGHTVGMEETELGELYVVTADHWGQYKIYWTSVWMLFKVEKL